MNEPRDSDSLVGIIRFQADRFMVEAACEAVDVLIAANPELKAVPDDLLHHGMIQLPDGRIADITWGINVVNLPSDTTQDEKKNH